MHRSQRMPFLPYSRAHRADMAHVLVEWFPDSWDPGHPLALALQPASFKPQHCAWQAGAPSVSAAWAGLGCVRVNLSVNFPHEVICTMKQEQEARHWHCLQLRNQFYFKLLLVTQSPLSSNCHLSWFVRSCPPRVCSPQECPGRFCCCISVAQWWPHENRLKSRSPQGLQTACTAQHG
jgi:hypothetical protein